MARQEGVIKLKGQMGGVSFYKTQEDGYLARQKGGVDAERIKNDPAFERTRENGAEFGRAGVASKLLRTALRSLLVNTADTRMASRLTSQMVKVIKADETNTRGKRNVIDGETELLQGFEFNFNAKLNRTLFAPFTTEINRDMGTLRVVVPDFVPGNMIAYPQGATHFKIIAAGVEMDFEAGAYVVDVQMSGDMEIIPAAQHIEPINIAVTPASTKPLILVVGIEFFQKVNEQLYSLKNGAHNALAIVKVDGGV